MTESLEETIKGLRQIVRENEKEIADLKSESDHKDVVINNLRDILSGIEYDAQRSEKNIIKS